MTEFFEIVDRDDKVIGKASRSECHSDPKLVHRGVFVLVLNAKGDILLSKRSMRKDTNPGRWEVIGEHVKPGESYRDAAVRGMKEELGIYGKPKRIANVLWSSEREAEFDEIFVCRIMDETIIKFNKTEISEIRFAPLRQVEKEIRQRLGSFSSWTIRVIKLYMQK